MYVEESCLSGDAGSGCVFLSGCVQTCVFCQNPEISRERGNGHRVTAPDLADAFLGLERRGCHNLHWVSPAHQLPMLVEALALARERGLTLPVVYNTGGYESVEVLRLLDGLVDVYLPDFKFWSEPLAHRYLRLGDYPEVARNALLEMRRQVGDLEVDANGLAVRGLLVRHLVMPGCAEDASHIFRWVASSLGPDTHVNVMPQYRPMHRSSRFPEIAESLKPEEWEVAVQSARAAGLHRLEPYRLPSPVTDEERRRRVIQECASARH